MKDSPVPSRRAAGRKIPSAGMTHLPMEWMDPMSWRLPSGKALAEFALQSGFIAPLLMGGPPMKKRKTMTPFENHVVKLPETSLQVKEVPDHSGTFRGQE
jgi:hypothetical protein